MSIKSDRWIRRMAEEHRMIEPFEAGQVKQLNGRPIVSYGTSSYGYDVRCSDEFKLFTDINTTIVDPKSFDPKSFVDVKGEFCIIPPNSFALARTVEYFRIPRSVLVVCLGKCVTGDTRVVDAETGAYIQIGEMRWGKSTLALRDWRLQPAKVSAVLRQGRKPVFELRTKAGLRIRTTANHPFRQLHGWTKLEDLAVGDRIAVARSVPVFGSTPLPDWEASLLGLMIAEGQCSTPGHSPTFTSSDPVLVDLLRGVVAESGLGTLSPEPRFGYRIVNRLGRGGVPEHNRATLWLKKYGLDVTAEDKFVPQAIFTAPRESVRRFLQALFAGDGGLYRSGDAFFLEYYSKSRRLVEDVHHLLLRFGVFGLIREKRTAFATDAYRLQITDREQIARFSSQVGFVPGCLKQVRLDREILPACSSSVPRRRSNFDTLPKEAWSVLSGAADGSGVSFNSMGVHPKRDQSVPYAAAAKVARVIDCGDAKALLTEGPIWDVVEEICPVGEEEVFDLTVPAAHNFLANGIVVHNSTYARCGVIVNVTPLEPEWEGHVTLEFSNTTPLPAKIYANEGVAQVIFLEAAADDVCETSYKDRGGKYQGQSGVTLPKI
jgi:deoxycytidine triphosphate deaminase